MTCFNKNEAKKNFFLKKKFQNGWLKKISFSSSANSQYFSWKFHGLVLGLVGLIDAKGINVVLNLNWIKNYDTNFSVSVFFANWQELMDLWNINFIFWYRHLVYPILKVLAWENWKWKKITKKFILKSQYQCQCCP